MRHKKAGTCSVTAPATGRSSSAPIVISGDACPFTSCKSYLLLASFAAFCLAAFAESTMSRVSVVTGANKGIGFAIAKKLAHTPGTICVLTARDSERGMKATRQLQAEGVDVVFKQLDIGDPSSVERFASQMDADYGRCDVLVNNAGIYPAGTRSMPLREAVEPTLKTNFFDTVAFTEKMLPLVRKSSAGRVVNVASGMGHLHILKSQSLRDAFTSASLTREELSRLMQQYVDDAKAGQHSSRGWSGNAYSMSKLGLIAYTKVAARDEQQAGSNVLINACCPGYVGTDMTSNMGHLTPEEGARTPYMVSQMKNIADGGVTGEFFQHEALSRW